MNVISPNDKFEVLLSEIQLCLQYHFTQDAEMADNLHEDVAPVTGNVFERNLRKVLTAEGYAGEALETKIKVLMQKDVSRLAAIILAPRQPQA